MGTAAWAQQVSVVALNNFGPPDSPIYYLTSGTAAPSNKGITVQLLGGPVGGTLAPVVSTDGKSTGTILDGADGYFDYGLGIVPGVTGAGPAQFELRAWEGASYDAAANKATKSWQQPTTAWDSTPPNPPPGSPAALQIPSNLLVGPAGPIIPEPSTIALGLLGAAALLIRRRK